MRLLEHVLATLQRELAGRAHDKSMMGRNRQGLRKLSADLIDKASDETAAQVVRLMALSK